MSLQKQKYILNNSLVKLRSSRIPGRFIALSEPVAVGLLIFVLVMGFQPMASYTPTHSTVTDPSKSITEQPKSKPKKIVKPKATTSKKASSSNIAPAPVSAPAYVPPAPAGTSRVEPVVKASPHSSVSGLKPTGSSGAGSSQDPGAQVTSGYTSSNWSGYMATGATFSGVSASWDATMATGNGSRTSADSTWIGIGGVTSDDLIQVGTQNTINASGKVTSSAFYEMLPDYAVTIPGVTVSEGDSITASLSEVSSGSWDISLTDNTDHESWSATVSYASSLSSAEWIEEDPSSSFRRLIPFDNFKEAYFTGGYTVVNGSTVSINSSTAQPVIMVNDSDQYIAVPSVIGGDGASFAVTP